jgi:hypothetical protein
LDAAAGGAAASAADARDPSFPTSLPSRRRTSRRRGVRIAREGDPLENGMTVSASNDDQTRQLLQLSEEVMRIAAALAKLSLGLEAKERGPETGNAPEVPDVPVQPVDFVFNARRARSRYLPDELFAEPAWDMLLDLFRCELRGRRLSTSDLCLGAGIPGSTALRWISAMVQKGVLIREPDRLDARRIFISLAPATSAALRRYFADVIEAR